MEGLAERARQTESSLIDGDGAGAIPLEVSRGLKGILFELHQLARALAEDSAE
jgi:hypothetical protein